MKLRPTFTAFTLRYFVFLYFLLWALFAIWLKGEVSYFWYIILWIFMTLLPALILSFKRVRIGWFFWIGLLDLIAFAPKFKYVYDKLLSFSSNPFYQDCVKFLRGSSEVKVYIAISLIGITFVQIYRLSFSYEIDKNGITLKSGIFSRNDRTLLPNQITDLIVNRNFLQRIFGIGTIVPITSSGMGMGSEKVFGGGTVSAKHAGVFMGTAKSVNIPIVNDPSKVMYGIKNPKKVSKEIFSIMQQNKEG